MLALLVWLPVLGLFVNTVVGASLPPSAWGTATQVADRDHVRQVLPQGWSFFTRDPREPRVFAYGKLDSGEWRELSRGSVNSYRGAFGLHRGARAHGLELGLLLAELEGGTWIDCGRGEHPPCLDSLESATGTVENQAARPVLCGTVGLVSQEPVPWAWRGRDSVRMPLQGMVVEVACP